jgi:MtfA peptidase
VATEHFFEQPHRLKQHHAELYDVLQMLYHVDPAEWPQCARSNR